MQTAGRDSDSEAPVRAAREFLQAVMLEDGLPAAVEAAESPTLLPELDPISRHLLIVELLEAGLYERLKEADPFDEETGDTYWSPLPYGGSVLGESDVTDSTSHSDDKRPGVRQARRFERAPSTPTASCRPPVRSGPSPRLGTPPTTCRPALPRSRRPTGSRTRRAMSASSSIRSSDRRSDSARTKRRG